MHFCARSWFFSVLVYPVITFVNPAIHSGSMKSAFRRIMDTDDFEEGRFSAEWNVTSGNPSKTSWFTPRWPLEFRWEKIPLLYMPPFGKREFLLAFMIPFKGGHGFAFVENWGKEPVEKLARCIVRTGWKKRFKNWLFEIMIFLRTLKKFLLRRRLNIPNWPIKKVPGVSW